jgi:molecular chaperone GrpE (heat shock protein)
MALAWALIATVRYLQTQAELKRHKEALYDAYRRPLQSELDDAQAYAGELEEELIDALSVINRLDRDSELHAQALEESLDDRLSELEHVLEALSSTEEDADEGTLDPATLTEIESHLFMAIQRLEDDRDSIKS